MKLLSQFSNRIQKYATRNNIIAIFILFVLIIAIMQGNTNKLKELNNGLGMLDMSYFGYSPTPVYEMFATIGLPGREIYTRLLGMDYIFAIIYMFFQSLMITRLLNKANVNAPWKMLNLLPFLRSGLDVIENCLLLTIILQYPGEYPILVLLSSAITTLKWVVYALVLLTLFSLGGYTFSHTFTNKKLVTKASKSL